MYNFHTISAMFFDIGNHENWGPRWDIFMTTHTSPKTYRISAEALDVEMQSHDYNY